MADDCRPERATERSQARRPFGPVVWTPIGKAWLETLHERAAAEDAAGSAPQTRPGTTQSTPLPGTAARTASPPTRHTGVLPAGAPERRPPAPRGAEDMGVTA